jgi:hypothetical protein
MSDQGPVSSDTNFIARSLLKQLLAVRPRHGAHLKILLNQALREQGVDPDSYFQPYPKFTAFLAAQSDLVEIDRKLDGAVIARLKEERRSAPLPYPLDLARKFRGDVWKSFVNSDPGRKRFLNRDTADIRHFVDPPIQPNDLKWSAIIRSNYASYVEIEFAGRETQSAWMREFLETTAGLPEWAKRPAMHFVDVPFESSVEIAFTNTLGPYGDTWRRFREGKIVELIQSWARRHGISLERLCRQDLWTTAAELPVAVHAGPQIASIESRPEIASTRTEPDNDEAAFRDLLSACTPEERSSILIPASAVLRYLRSRR